MAETYKYPDDWPEEHITELEEIMAFLQKDLPYDPDTNLFVAETLIFYLIENPDNIPTFHDLVVKGETGEWE